MKSRQSNIYIWLTASLVGMIGTLVIQPAWAEVKAENNTQKASLMQQDGGNRKIRQLSELEIPLTSAQHLLVQSPTPTNPTSQGNVIPITSVKANPTDKGVEIILETPAGTQLQVTNRSTDNNFIADVSGGQLRLPSGDAFTFRSEKLIAGITQVTVTNIDPNTVRVTVVGEKALPTVELFDDDAGLVFGITTAATAMQPSPQPETPQEKPAAQEGEPIELVVTGEQDGYNVPDASTATKTDTPLRDIPQSIQVVPRQVLEDRGVRREVEALETVSGVVDFDTRPTELGTQVYIRGFGSGVSLRNGLRNQGFTSIGTVERVEVLKGPASVLFGALEPGGIVNYVTRQPLAEPYYKIGFEAGSYGFYQPSIDLSGPLTADKSVLYRLIATYQRGGDFKDDTPINEQVISIAPSITFRLGDRTDINVYYEYNRHDENYTFEPLLGDGSFIPSNVYTDYFSSATSKDQRVGYTLNHRFNDSWQLRQNFSATFSTGLTKQIGYGNLLNDRFLTDYYAYSFDSPENTYAGLIDLVGKFKTGSISHQLVAGFDFARQVSYLAFYGNSFDLPPLDIFNPNHDVLLPEIPSGPFSSPTISQSYGVYLQDQIAFSDNFKMLIGGRYDWIIQNDGAFSPRIGLVYQPSRNVSLYTSYSQSFNPSSGPNLNNEPFKPTRGTQYEVGVRADFLDGKLSANLAAYNLTKTNVPTPDPDPILAQQGFQVQVGEQRSRGIELDVTGEILRGWNIVASYALTGTEVTEDSSIPSTVGNRFQGIPQHQASLWSTYTLQKGALQGLGFGLGLFYVGERQGDLANSFQVDDYLRTDAALFYRRNGFNAAINVRNLFDIDYVSSVSSGILFINRGTPLSITGSVSWEF
ncbi:TonB-dependent siderophore receptor [Nostoc sp. LPT]|uniref:TonB-dependent siderophore receptor n=1 Tax=Nostoc sp. LPT TaxID=2815387 RepID=UPI001D55CBA7|nr:TonB-dependent siderophore receptor [Nostoc sp. LPT]MBN4006331.1 TonB-dependent siderophore receptor [Nostoc sp. LPT]